MSAQRAALLVGIGVTILVESSVPAMAWWQFVSIGQNGERKASQRFNTEEECKVALKATEGALKKAYPGRFPLVGSCEQFQ